MVETTNLRAATLRALRDLDVDTMTMRVSVTERARRVVAEAQARESPAAALVHRPTSGE